MSRSDSRFPTPFAQSGARAQLPPGAINSGQGPEDEPEPLSLRPRPWWRLTFAYAFLALGVGLLVFLILMIRRPPDVSVVLIGSGYEADLSTPLNAYGWRGLKDLNSELESSYSGSASANRHWLHAPRVHTTKPLDVSLDERNWDKRIRDFTRRPTGANLILFVTLHPAHRTDAAHSDGGVLELLRDGSHYGSDGYISLVCSDEHQVQTLLKSFPLEPRRNRRPKILIFLDASHLEADWRRGIVYNDFVRQLKRPSFQKDIWDRNLVILCSSDEAQHSWVNETTGRSIFSEYVMEGLRGDADVEGLPTISARQLCQYVQKRVARWVFNNRLQGAQDPLLLPEKDGAESAERIRLVMPDRRQKPAPPPEKHWEPIREAWKHYVVIANQTLSRAVYTPQLWRQYRDTLIRAEQLYRAREDDAGDNLLKGLPALEAKMRLEPLQTPDRSLKYSLPLAEALGGKEQVKNDNKKATKELESLLSVLDTKLDNNIRKEIAKLVGDTADSPAAKKEASVHSTELQFLAAFYDFYFKSPEGPKGKAVPSWSQLKTALKLRLLAEEVALATAGVSDDAHPYSEQILPCIQTKVERADSLRRHAEDLLFASSSTDWKLSDQEFSESEVSYEDARRIIVAVRDALSLRDKVLADVPYYAQWAIHYPEEVRSDLLFEVPRLAEHVHELATLLAPVDAGVERIELESIVKKSNALKESLDTVERIRDQRIDQVNLSEEPTPTSHARCEALLYTPFLKPETRVRYLEHLAKPIISQTPFPGSDAERHRASNEYARKLAYREAVMALALLGDEGLQLGNPNLNGQDVWRRLERVNDGREQDWQQVMSEIGNYVGKSWEVIDRLIDNTNTNQRPPDEKSHEAYLVRHLDGATADAKPDFNPLVERRKTQMHRLLCWEATRFVRDYWWDEFKRPYYYNAATSCLEDAKEFRKVVTFDGKVKKDLESKEQEKRTQLEAGLKEPFLFVSSDKTQLDVTEGQKAEVKTTLQYPPAFALPGQAVYWSAGAPVKRDSKPMNERDQNTLSLPSPVAVAGQKTIGTQAYFRGRWQNDMRSIVSQNAPDITFREFVPTRVAGVAIRADAKEFKAQALYNGAVSIVVDFSNSMRGTKIRNAIDALDEIMKELNGVAVTVWIFSHQVNGDPEDEKTIEQIQNAVSWNDEVQKEVIAKLRKKVPFGNTPLVRTMYEAAKKDLMSGKQFENKVLLVLTDGKDNRFVKGEFSAKGDPVYNKKSKGDTKEIPAFLKETFKDSDIRINMVFFNAPNEELDTIKDQFECIEDKAWRTPGKLYYAQDAAVLKEKLHAGLLGEFYYDLRDSNDKPIKPATGERRKITHAEDNSIEWFGIKDLVEGQHTLQLRGRSTKVDLQRDTFMLLRIKGTGQLGPVLERSLWCDELGESIPEDRKKTEGDWHVGVFECKERLDQCVEMLIALENGKTRRTEPLRLPKPAFTWLELLPEASKPAPAYTWGPLNGVDTTSDRPNQVSGYPAYTLGLETLAKWPLERAMPVGANVHLWWSMDEPKSIRKPVRDLRGATLAAPLEIREDGQVVLVEECKFESRSVTTGPGKQEPQPCLVVRLRNSTAGEPSVAYFPRPERMGILGSEFQIFNQAKKSTCIFWPVKEADLQSVISEISLLSIGEFKKGSQTLNKIMGPYSPQTRDSRDLLPYRFLRP